MRGKTDIEAIPPEAAEDSKARAPRRMSLPVALGVLAGLVASVGLLGVVAAGFSLSFEAIAAVAVASRIAPGHAWLMPVSIDGAMLVASVNVVVAQRLGQRRWYPFTVVIVGALISFACNGLHALGQPDEALRLAPVLRFAVSAIPPLMLALSTHLLVELLKGAASQGESPAPKATPARQARQAGRSKPEASRAPALPRKVASFDEVGQHREAKLTRQLEVLREWAQAHDGQVPPRETAKKVAKCGSDTADKLIDILRAEQDGRQATG